MLLSYGFRIAVLCLCFMLAVATPAGPQELEANSTPTFKTLVNFDGTNGEQPHGSLVQGTDGNLYGTTYSGGTYGGGTIFKITAGVKLATLYNFCPRVGCPDGAGPAAGLVQATDGNFYGTTSSGGDLKCNPPDGCGTVFKMTPGGTLTTLHTFHGSDGANSFLASAALVQATDGNLYGTTTYGGALACDDGNGGRGCGTIFRITLEGALTTLHAFTEPDGAVPYAALVQATDGNFYGTTSAGGTNCIGGCGTVFKISPAGTLTTVYSFCPKANCTDGDVPLAALVQATDGNFYGTTAGGGTSKNCNGSGCGTAFKITAAGKLTTLHSFDDTDGSSPYAGMIQATDGKFYGTTFGGGDYEYGTAFQITQSGELANLSFDGSDGTSPVAGLVQGTDGSFYGTTFDGANNNRFGGCGTVFSVSLGLGPFAETRPTSGKVGTAVEILGNNLAGATSVTFNGTAAKFKIVSGSEITTTVPASATTGKVEVKTPTRTLSSNVVFRVTQ